MRSLATIRAEHDSGRRVTIPPPPACYTLAEACRRSLIGAARTVSIDHEPHPSIADALYASAGGRRAHYFSRERGSWDTDFARALALASKPVWLPCGI